MLPDFPALKADLQHVLTLHLRKTVNETDPVVQGISKTFQHEGTTRAIIRSGGDRDPFDYQHLEATASIPKDRLHSLTLSDLLEHMEVAGRDMAAQVARRMYEKLEKSSHLAGTATDAGGQPLDFDLFLQGLAKLQIDFDGSIERPLMPTIAVGPGLQPRLAELVPKWEADPDCQRQMAALIRRKYEEWRARQDRKQLVD